MLRVTSVRKSFRRNAIEVSVLRDASLEVAAGQFVIVQGPSGCGKTTLLLVAGGLLAPDAGTVEIDGRSPYELGHDARATFRADRLGFVFQQFHLIPYLSVRDNVLSPLLARATDDAGAHTDASARDDASAWADALIARFGLTDRAAHRPGELSVGECQRTALARAMLNRPKLILADEPTGNLDEVNARIVLTGLAEFVEAGGAVLLVTHDPQAAAYSHRSLQMVNGAI